MKAECLEALRGFIERADRAELADAQSAIIHFAMSHPDRASRLEAMSTLRTDLTTELDAGAWGLEQHAYRSVLESMIDRTREVLEGMADKTGS